MDISQKLLEIWSWKFAHFLIHIWWTLLANFIEFWHGYLLNWHRMTSSYRFTLLFIVAVINRSNCGLRKWLYSLFPAGFSLSFTSCNRIQSGLLGSRSEIFLHYPIALFVTFLATIHYYSCCYSRQKQCCGRGFSIWKFWIVVSVSNWIKSKVTIPFDLKCWNFAHH